MWQQKRATEWLFLHDAFEQPGEEAVEHRLTKHLNLLHQFRINDSKSLFIIMRANDLPKPAIFKLNRKQLAGIFEHLDTDDLVNLRFACRRLHNAVTAYIDKLQVLVNWYEIHFSLFRLFQLFDLNFHNKNLKRLLFIDRTLALSLLSSSGTAVWMANLV